MIRLAFVIWTLLEVAAFVLAGRAVGVLGVIALVLLTALLGGALLRRQGARALSELRGGVRRGGDPLRLPRFAVGPSAGASLGALLQARFDPRAVAAGG